MLRGHLSAKWDPLPSRPPQTLGIWVDFFGIHIITHKRAIGPKMYVHAQPRKYFWNVPGIVANKITKQNFMELLPFTQTFIKECSGRGRARKGAFARLCRWR